MMNKRGAEVGNMLSIFYFMTLAIIVGFGISWGAIIYYGNGFDIKGLQADWLADDMTKCLNNNPVNFNSDTDFYDVCNYNKKVLETNNFVFRICEDNCYKENSKAVFFLSGNYQLCGFSKVTDPNAPACAERNMVLNGKNLHIVVASRNNGRRV